jgi:hypothetical protein
MQTQVVVACSTELPFIIIDDWREQCRSLADYLGTAVELWRLDGPDRSGKSDLSGVLARAQREQCDVIAPRARLFPPPMASARFLWRADGRPDWGAMWGGFCDLALLGGPPHRGLHNALQMPAPNPGVPLADDMTAVDEIQRGIWETTGLKSVVTSPGWLEVLCESRKMAAWLCAIIILENIEARCEDDRLLVPGDPSFTLQDQVKSIITVVAKTYGFWKTNVAERLGAS